MDLTKLKAINLAFLLQSQLGPMAQGLWVYQSINSNQQRQNANMWVMVRTHSKFHLLTSSRDSFRWPWPCFIGQSQWFIESLILAFNRRFPFSTFSIWIVVPLVAVMMVMMTWPAMGLIFFLLVLPAPTSTLIRALKAFTAAPMLLLTPHWELQWVVILFSVRNWPWCTNQSYMCEENKVTCMGTIIKNSIHGFKPQINLPWK